MPLSLLQLRELKPLIDQLDQRFPDRCARPGMSQEEIWMEAGARQVINYLNALQANLEDKH